MGANNLLPFSEEANTDQPLSPYAASKKGAESLCHSYHHLYGIDVTIFRFFTVYGPAGRPDMSAFRFVQWISEGKNLLLSMAMASSPHETIPTSKTLPGV